MKVKIKGLFSLIKIKISDNSKIYESLETGIEYDNYFFFMDK